MSITVGKSVARVDAFDKVTGRTKYYGGGGGHRRRGEGADLL